LRSTSSASVRLSISILITTPCLQQVCASNHPRFWCGPVPV